MGLNIKNAAVERLAREVAELAGETKTEAVRRALEERMARLELGAARMTRVEMLEWLERDVWSQIPPELRGKRITKQEREEILGYGPEGV